MRRAALSLLVGLVLAISLIGSVLAQEPDIPGPGLVQHTVQEGDTLEEISEYYDISVQEIADHNSISPNAVLHVGAILEIPGTLHFLEMQAGYWTVQQEDTLYSIARAVGSTVAAMAAYNGIENPNLIVNGTQLQIPPADYAPPEGPVTVSPTEAADTTEEETEAEDVEGEEEEETPTPATTTVSPPPPANISASGVTVTFDPILYSGDRRYATVMINVTNNSIDPAIAGGRYHVERDPVEGALQWVTLVGAVHDIIPYPEVHDEPLWHATVYYDDGLVFPAYAGCQYIETVYAEGDEPLDRRLDIWFHWEMILYDGWFDCGNTYQVKPEDLLPGDSASVPLNILMEHPRDRDWNATIFGVRNISRIDLELFDSNGNSLGTVYSETYSVEE